MAPTNVLHLRAETKPLEHRSALTPSTTKVSKQPCSPPTDPGVRLTCSGNYSKALVDAGYTVNVERCSQRIFDDSEFEQAGATLVANGSWVDAPADHIIVGLKELEEKDCKYPLTFCHPSLTWYEDLC